MLVRATGLAARALSDGTSALSRLPTVGGVTRARRPRLVAMPRGAWPASPPVPAVSLVARSQQVMDFRELPTKDGGPPNASPGGPPPFHDPAVSTKSGS